MKWATLNVGGDVGRDPTVWDHQRELYRNAGIPHGPWMHVHAMEDIAFLIEVANDWKADILGPNIEDVVGDKLSLQEIGDYLQHHWVAPTNGKPVHMPVLPWLPNGQGWQHVAFAWLALEVFPKEQPQLATPEVIAQCIEHAFTEGAQHVTMLYSTTSPGWPYPPIAHCLYTADDVTDWSVWKDDRPQVVPKPPTPPTPPTPEVPKMLTEKQYPYTGPCFGPGPRQTVNYSTVKGIKRAMIRLGYLKQPLGEESDDYGASLRSAMKLYQHHEHLTENGDYGRSEYAALRGEKLTTGPHAGEYAMDALALKYVREDLLALCYPHPDVPGTFIGQGLHPTLGVPGNWAIDFMAPGGTPILAVERCTIMRFSGHDPSLPPNDAAGIWGLTTYFQTAAGYTYFLTHQDQRTCKIGQVMEVGQQVGRVGRWPGDPGRSHSHLGVSSVKGTSDAKAHITAVSKAPRFPDL